MFVCVDINCDKLKIELKSTVETIHVATFGILHRLVIWYFYFFRTCTNSSSSGQSAFLEHTLDLSIHKIQMLELNELGESSKTWLVSS